MEKYLLTATLRRDGSTKFGAENKYGNFPSVALAWRVSQEEFVQNLNAFSNLKLRFGWGITGNQEIGSKHSLFSIGTSNAAKAVMDGSTIVPGYVLLKTPNEFIQWESTTQTNIGVDFGFFRGRLSGTIDLFSKSTTNMLLETAAKLPAPTARQVGNIDASIINKGIEVGLTGYIFDKSDFDWKINVNFSKINNTVKDLEVTQIATGEASGQGMTGVTTQVITNDEPINSFYGRKFLGLDENGISIYQDTDDEVGDDMIILGSPLPDYTFSINNTFVYKQFDLSIFIQGVQGNLIYNNTAQSIGTVPNINSGNNTFPDVITSGESILNANRFSNRFLEDGSYIRLSNATLGYNFKADNISWLSNLRIYIAGNNLFLITNYSGYDPDVNTDANKDGIASMGIDNTNYPKARSFTFGLNVTF
ncbi:TonB-dependent receptor P3 [subsurface metagenome]